VSYNSVADNTGLSSFV